MRVSSIPALRYPGSQPNFGFESQSAALWMICERDPPLLNCGPSLNIYRGFYYLAITVRMAFTVNPARAPAVPCVSVRQVSIPAFAHAGPGSIS
jgi:hypothetical protein